MIKDIWILDKQVTFHTISEVFRIISSDKETSIALGKVTFLTGSYYLKRKIMIFFLCLATMTEIVPITILPALFQDVLQNSAGSYGMLVKGFDRIVLWLPWPINESTPSQSPHTWVLNFLVALKDTKMFECLVDVIYSNVVQVFYTRLFL